MKGSTFKRCTCPPVYDARGNRKNCGKRHGSWSYVLDAGKDPRTGKRRQVKKGGFPTQAEAEEALAEAITEVNQGQYRHTGKQTLATWLETWLEHKETELRPTTLANYRRWARTASEQLGHHQLRDLQTSHISQAYRNITAANALRGVGTTTTRRIHTVLSSALSDARREGLIRHNPASEAMAPKEVRAKVNPWSGEELGCFLDHAGTHAFGPIFELMALAGLRRGEALGLRWSDVDLTAGHLVVRQQLVAVQDDSRVPVEKRRCPSCGEVHPGCRFGPPKTDRGEARRVELGQTGVGVLLTVKLAQDEARAKWGDLYVDHDLVFAREDGNPIRPDYVTRAFGQLVKDAGLRHQRLHDLRHGRASLMLAAGVDIAIVSKMLGHSSIRITADTYSHMLEGVGRQAAEAADALIVRRSRDQSVTSPTSETAQALSFEEGKGL